MDYDSIIYEGVLSGIDEQAFRRIGKLLRNAFPGAELDFGAGGGAMVLSGRSAMFEEDEENRTAVFDPLAERAMGAGSRGVILGRRWSREGSVEILVWEFKAKSWTEERYLAGGEQPGEEPKEDAPGA